MTWIAYAAFILYFHFGYAWGAQGLAVDVAAVAGAILAMAFLLSLACIVLLQMVRQDEEGGRVSLFRALSRSLTRGLLPTLAVAFVWGTVWFAITLVQALIPRRRRKGGEDAGEMTAESAARALVGDGRWSISDSFFDALRKAGRMVAFLVLAAVAIEGKGTRGAFRRGFQVVRQNLRPFAAGFALTEVAAALVFLPVGLFLYITSKADLVWPQTVWYGVIGYLAVAWSLSLYLEQMYCAGLYLWYVAWERHVAAASAAGQPVLPMSQVRPPQLFDGVPDLQRAPQPLSSNVVAKLPDPFGLDLVTRR